jgi:hypothetical protein
MIRGLDLFREHFASRACCIHDIRIDPRDLVRGIVAQRELSDIKVRVVQALLGLHAALSCLRKHAI